MKKIIVLLFLSVLLSCELVPEEDIADIVKQPIPVEYKVTCTTGLVDLTISNEDEGTSQFDDMATPWSYSFEVNNPEYGYFFVYVSAQNQQSSGTVTAQIYVNNSLYKTSTSTGAYVIASASGSVTW